jgi:hypothetical protein
MKFLLFLLAFTSFGAFSIDKEQIKKDAIYFAKSSMNLSEAEATQFGDYVLSKEQPVEYLNTYQIAYRYASRPGNLSLLGLGLSSNDSRQFARTMSDKPSAGAQLQLHREVAKFILGTGFYSNLKYDQQISLAQKFFEVLTKQKNSELSWREFIKAYKIISQDPKKEKHVALDEANKVLTADNPTEALQAIQKQAPKPKQPKKVEPPLTTEEIRKKAYAYARSSKGLDKDADDAKEFVKEVMQKPNPEKYLKAHIKSFRYAYKEDKLNLDRDDSLEFAENVTSEKKPESYLKKFKKAYSFAYNSDGLNHDHDDAKDFASEVADMKKGLTYLKNYRKAYDYAYSQDGLDLDRDEAKEFADEHHDRPDLDKFIENHRKALAYAYNQDGLNLDAAEAREFADEQ